MIKLVIFDMDGTLLNSIVDLAEACNVMLEKRGFPLHEVKEYQYFVGDGMRKLVERCLPEKEAADSEYVETALRDFLAHYQLHSADHTRPYDGIPELVKELTQKGIGVAVATNKRQDALEILLKKFFPDITWAAAYGQRAGVPIKPDPQVVYDILENTGVPADEVLYLGDTAVDMRTADNAGVKKIAVLWGYRTRQELIDAGATDFADTPAEILEKLEVWNEE